MRLIVLNMMILGAMSCLVENDVFAGNFDPKRVDAQARNPNENPSYQKKNPQSDKNIRLNEIHHSYSSAQSQRSVEKMQSNSGKLSSTNSLPSPVESAEPVQPYQPAEKGNENSRSDKNIRLNEIHHSYSSAQSQRSVEKMQSNSGKLSSTNSLPSPVESAEPVQPYQPAEKGNENSAQAGSASELSSPIVQKGNADMLFESAESVQPYQPAEKGNENSAQAGSASELSSPIVQKGDADVLLLQSPAQAEKANISGGIPKAPPPPPPMGMISSVQANADTSDLMNGLREELDKFLDSNDVVTMANIVNFYLQGNKGKISEGVDIANASTMRLIDRLDKDLDKLNKISASNPTVKKFSELLESLRDPLQKLTKKSYQAKNLDFKEVSQKINEIAFAYFSKVMESGESLKNIPNLAALKDAEIVLERAVVLADSFSNLVDLVEKPELKAFSSERAVRDAIAIINLKRFIVNKLKEADSASSNNIVRPSSGEVLTEKELLEKVLKYIDETCRGNNELSLLLDIRDILNYTYTTLASSDQQSSAKDPLTVISQLNDRIIGVGPLLEKASMAARSSDYSQFGRMFTEGDTGYGAALIPSVNQWIDSEDFAEFSDDKIRKVFQGKKLTKNVVEEYIELLTHDMDLCRSFAKSVISKMASQAKFKSSAYVSIAKQTEAKKEDQQILLEITNGKTKLGSSSDPNKDKNMIPFSMLKKNCEEYIKEMSAIDKDMKGISEMMKKEERSLSTKISNKVFANYVNNILTRYFVFKEFSPHGDQISLSVVNTEKGLLSEKDVPNVLFALSQNCDLAVKQPALPLFPTSKDTDNLWVFKMALDLYAITSETIKAILVAHDEVFSGKEEIKGTKVEEIIQKLDNLKRSIGDTIYQNEVLKNVFQRLKISLEKAKVEISAKQVDEVKFSKIADQIRRLSKLMKGLLSNLCTESQSDKGELQKINNDLEGIETSIDEVISSENPKKAEQIDEVKLSKIADQIRRLSELTNDVFNLCEKSQSDKGELQKINNDPEGINEVISSENRKKSELTVTKPNGRVMENPKKAKLTVTERKREM